MKAVLFGGPFDGKIEEVRRNVFGICRVKAVFKKLPNGEKLVRVDEHFYSSDGRCFHTCVKRGTVLRFTYCKKRPAWAGSRKDSRAKAIELGKES